MSPGISERTNTSHFPLSTHFQIVDPGSQPFQSGIYFYTGIFNSGAPSRFSFKQLGEKQIHGYWAVSEQHFATACSLLVYGGLWGSNKINTGHVRACVCFERVQDSTGRDINTSTRGFGCYARIKREFNLIYGLIGESEYCGSRQSTKQAKFEVVKVQSKPSPK